MPKGSLTSGVDRSCAIRPPRCATGPRMVTQRAATHLALDYDQVESGAFHINYNTMSCMEGSDRVVVHPLMRDESGEENKEQSKTPLKSSSSSPMKGGASPSSTVPSPPPRSRKQGGGAELHHRHRLAGGGGTFQTQQNITDHSQIPFSVKTQLEIWLAAFDEEASKHRSLSICFEMLLQRVGQVSEDQQQPSLFSLVSGLILLTKFVPLLGPYGDLTQGIIAELAAAVYLLPSKGVGFTVALEPYARKTFFDAFREVKVLYDLHQARAKKYRSLLRLEANVLQNTIDRLGWQSMNLTFRGWRNVVRLRKKKFEYLRRFFDRWKVRQFVPKAVGRWHRYARLTVLLAKEQQNLDDTALRLQILYAQEQSLKAQRFAAEGEKERLTAFEASLIGTNHTLREKLFEKTMRAKFMADQYRKVTWSWIGVMHAMFGDAHELVIQNEKTGTSLTIQAEAAETTTTTSADGRRQSKIGPPPPPSTRPESGGSPTTRKSAVGEALVPSSPLLRKPSGSNRANISDSAATFRRKVATKQQRQTTFGTLAFVHRFAPYLREIIPKLLSSEDLAELTMYEVRKVLSHVEPVPIRVKDLAVGEQISLNLIVQVLFAVFLGGHCSLFMDEGVLGPPRMIAMKRKPRSKEKAAASSKQPEKDSYDGNTSMASNGSSTPPPPSSLLLTAAAAPAAPSSAPSETIVLLTPPERCVITNADEKQRSGETGGEDEMLTPSAQPLSSVGTRGLTPPVGEPQYPVLVAFDHRVPFESELLHPKFHQDWMNTATGSVGVNATGSDLAVEATCMIHDTQHGMELLHPLEVVYKETMKYFTNAAQQGEGNRLHHAAQRFMDMFTLFDGGMAPMKVIEGSVKTMVNTKDWKKLERMYPSEGISNSVDLMQYARDVAAVASLSLERVMLYLESGLEFDPMMKLFVLAASEDVRSAVNQHRDALKNISRRCCAMISLVPPTQKPQQLPPPPTAAEDASSGGGGEGDASAGMSDALLLRRKSSVGSRILAARRGQGRRLVIQKELWLKFVVNMPLADRIEESVAEMAFQQVLQLRSPLAPKDVTYVDDGVLIVFALFLANFFDVNPYHSSAVKLVKLFEWVTINYSAK